MTELSPVAITYTRTGALVFLRHPVAYLGHTHSKHPVQKHIGPHKHPVSQAHQIVFRVTAHDALRHTTDRPKVKSQLFSLRTLPALYTTDHNLLPINHHSSQPASSQPLNHGLSLGTTSISGLAFGGWVYGLDSIMGWLGGGGPAWLLMVQFGV